jgi:predicted unusual protein kinase regulating ubiquinone biosynthesis (AarF/ABC1/UbiB family)
MRKEKEKIIINLLDAGMVIRLEERDKKIFVNFIKAVI